MDLYMGEAAPVIGSAIGKYPKTYVNNLSIQRFRFRWKLSKLSQFYTTPNKKRRGENKASHAACGVADEVTACASRPTLYFLVSPLERGIQTSIALIGIASTLRNALMDRSNSAVTDCTWSAASKLPLTP